MDEVTARPIRTETNRVKCSTKFGLVLGMSTQRSLLMHSMCKLTLLTILAVATLFEWPAQFSLVSAAVHALKHRA